MIESRPMREAECSLGSRWRREREDEARIQEGSQEMSVTKFRKPIVEAGYEGADPSNSPLELSYVWSRNEILLSPWDVSIQLPEKIRGNDSKPVKMIEDEGIGVHHNRLADSCNPVVGNIPRGKACTPMLHNNNVSKPPWPVLEVLLISISPIDRFGGARFQATRAPVLQASGPLCVIPEGHEADIVHPMDLGEMGPGWREAMFDNQNRLIAELLAYRLGISEKKQVGIEIRHDLDLRPLPQNVERERRGARPIILDRTPIRSRLDKRKIALLKRRS